MRGQRPRAVGDPGTTAPRPPADPIVAALVLAIRGALERQAAEGVTRDRRIGRVDAPDGRAA
jgi:hypothetical protein